MPFERPVLLADLAREAGYNSASLAENCAMDKSTVSRMWTDPDWINSMNPQTYLQLIGLIPGVAEHIEKHALNLRYAQIAKTVRAKSAAMDLDKALDRLRDAGVSAQTAYSTVTAGVAILTGDLVESVAVLRPLWGRAQTYALDILYGDPSDESPDAVELLDSSERLLTRLFQDRDCGAMAFSRSVAMTHLSHHLAKHGRFVSGLDSEKLTQSYRGAKAQKLSFAARGAFIGRLRSNDDFEAALQYDRLVRGNYTALAVEQWAFPTWSGDLPNAANFEVPNFIPLSHTAPEVIREVREYNEAYVLYLLKTYIPLALERQDPQFGGRLSELKQSVAHRMERSNSRKLQKSGEALLEQIAREEKA